VSDVATPDSDMGRKVKVGVRPEDFVQTSDEIFVYEGKVDIVEALGEVTLLYFMAVSGADPVIAKLPGIHKDVRGSVVRLGAAPPKVHLFASGVSLRHR
jgi:alpha-glucoside transport system ATP-binding protein